MIACTVLAGLLLASHPQSAEEWLAVGRFDAALAAADALEDPVRRSRARRRVLHQAGDLPGALREGLAGLSEATDDLELLLGTVDVAVALGRARTAGEIARRLDGAVSALPPETEYRDWWVTRAAEYLDHAAELEELDVRRSRALVRSRAVAFLGIGTALTLLVGLVLRRGAAPTG